MSMVLCCLNDCDGRKLKTVYMFQIMRLRPLVDICGRRDIASYVEAWAWGALICFEGSNARLLDAGVSLASNFEPIFSMPPQIGGMRAMLKVWRQNQLLVGWN